MCVCVWGGGHTVKQSFHSIGSNWIIDSVYGWGGRARGRVWGGGRGRGLGFERGGVRGGGVGVYCMHTGAMCLGGKGIPV